MSNTKKINKSETAESYFHSAPYHYNCAQAVAKAFQQEFSVTDNTIENYRRCGGGRAENGHCGAYYAAIKLLADTPDKEQLFSEKFTSIANGTDCITLRGSRNLSCRELVKLASNIVEDITGSAN